MKPDTTQTGALERLGEFPMPKVIGVDWRAVPTVKHEVAPTVSGVLAERLLQRHRHVDRSPRASGLRRAELALPQRPADMDAVTLEVDVGPLQSTELTLTHPGEHGREEQRLERLLLRLDEAPHFLRGQDLDFGLFTTGKLDVLRRIRVEVAPLDCVLAHLLEDQDHVA